MRFILTAISLDAKNVAPSPQLYAALGELGEKMTKAGKLIESGGISLHGKRVTLADGEMTVTDGPFAEAKEVVGGYAVVQVSTEAEAVEMAKEFLELHRRFLGDAYAAENEVRRLFGPWDRPAAAPG